MRTPILWFMLLWPGLAVAQPRDAIRMFVRAESGREDERVFPLASLPVAEREQFDVQYDARFVYRGIRLRDLIARYSPPAAVDTALLHFRNGMVIPLPFRDAAVMDRLDPMLATAIKIGEGSRAWTRRFPSLSRENEDYFDLRPTTFEKNKLVVKQRWHPSLAANAEGSFSPWMHADSLAEIELAQADAYFAQFDVDYAPETHRGFDVFRQSCAFCHGAQGVGAKFGFDLVSPRPLYEYQRPFARFYYHVRFRAPDAPQKGLMMPALSYMSESQAHAVWYWLQAIARHGVRPYQPRTSQAQGLPLIPVMLLQQAVESQGWCSAPAAAAVEPAGTARGADFILVLLAIAIAIAGLGYVRANERWRKASDRSPRAIDFVPYAAGGGLGIVIVASLVAFGRPVGASGAFAHLVHGNITWQVWVIVGVFAGALVGAVAGGRFRLRTIPEFGWTETWGRSRALRWAIAFASAIVIEIASVIAGGCTSGLALSGGIVLAPAAFLFMAAMFATGIPAATWAARKRKAS